MTTKKKIGAHRFRFEVVHSGKNWFWRAVAQRNGKIVADGGEGYRGRAHCMDEVKLLTAGQWPITMLGFNGKRELLYEPAPKTVAGP